jgi:hypothetical protein
MVCEFGIRTHDDLMHEILNLLGHPFDIIIRYVVHQTDRVTDCPADKRNGPLRMFRCHYWVLRIAIEHICQSGDEVCEQAYQSEHEHYQIMEEEANQDAELAVAEIMETYNPPDWYQLNEYTNDLGGDADPRWNEDGNLTSPDHERIGYDIDDYNKG